MIRAVPTQSALCRRGESGPDLATDLPHTTGTPPNRSYRLEQTWSDTCPMELQTMTRTVDSVGIREGRRMPSLPRQAGSWPGLGRLVLGLLLLISLQSTIQAQVWTNIGRVLAPNLRITSVAVDPVNPNRWLVGSGKAGLFETVDAGKSFTPISDNWPTQVVGAIAFASSEPNVIYVGTGEPESQGRAHAGLGLMKSTDGGQTWNLVGASSFVRAAVKSIRVHPADANVVLAATVRGGFGRDAQEITPSPAPLGVLRSTDGGLTWVRTLAGLATALDVDPRNFNNQYAGVGNQRIGPNLPDSASHVPNGIYRSTDGGLTWREVAGPWGSSTATSAAMGRIEIAIAPSNPDVMYVSMQIPPNGGSSLTGLLGLYRTDNAWAATPVWIKVPTEATGSGNPGHSYCYDAHTGCGAMHVLGVDPLDATRLFAGGAHANLWLCTGCGPSPAWANRTSPDGDHHALVWAGNRLINGQDHGLFSTINNGGTWESHNEALPVGMFTSGALHPTDPNTVFGAFEDLSGIYRRTAAGTFRRVTGQQAGNLCPGASTPCQFGEADLEISTARPDTDWALTATFGKIGRTTNGGQTWTVADAGIDTTGAASIAPIQKCLTNDDVFLTGTNRLWRTNSFFNSAAPSWSANSPAHPFQFPRALAAPGTILSVAFAPSDPECNTYAYGNRGGEIQLTTDGGATWKNLDPGKNLPSRPINSIAFDPANPDVIFVALSSFDEGTPGKPGHLFTTVNARSDTPAWTNISPPDNRPFNVIVIEPRDPNLIYAGSDTGLWYSPNRGIGWQRWGLPSVAVYDVKINPTTNVVVAFTNGRGAFRLDAPAVPSSGPLLSIPRNSSVFNAVTGDSYSQDLTATGGKTLYTWSVGPGALPPGLTLSPAGRLSGIPKSAGRFAFTIVVTDHAGTSASQTYSMNVVNAETR
jgi:photosystem II stability/assembly factor-like uncharacterized protein